MIIVTGAAGFIGSNLVRALNVRGETEILVVDEQHRLDHPENLADCSFRAALDKREFRKQVKSSSGPDLRPRCVVHLGACTDTTERDLAYLMDNNFAWSRDLLDRCLAWNCPLIYASSAAVYGVGGEFHESPGCENPNNGYGRSKCEFDRHVRSVLQASQASIAGLRFFNVYGPRESHKGKMASVAFHFNRQLLDSGAVRLFRGSGGYADGEQRRDFIHVDDVVSVLLWFMERPAVHGIFNLGTGRSRSFNDVARAVIGWHGRGRIEYVDFPDELAGRYQSFTEADLASLRAAGHGASFLSLEEGIPAYLDWLNRT